MHNTPRSRAASSPDYKVEQDQSCAPSHAPLVGQRVRGRPVGLEGAAQCPPMLKENGSSSARVTGASVKSHVSEAFEARGGRGANRLGGCSGGAGQSNGRRGDIGSLVLGEGQCRSGLTPGRAALGQQRMGVDFNI